MAKGLLAINDALFRELERLEDVDITKPKQMQSEIDRAQAIVGLTTTAVNNGKLALAIAQAGTKVGEAVHVPKGLIGE